MVVLSYIRLFSTHTRRGGAISYDPAFCHHLLGVPRWLETFQMGSTFSAAVVLGCLFQGLMGLQEEAVDEGTLQY